jgi:hypothetical protein
MVDKAKREAEWAEAARLCPLSEDEVRMAREMGFNPRSLIKNIPDPQDSTKAPIGAWVRERYEKRQARASQKVQQKPRGARSGAPRAAAAPPPPPETAELADLPPDDSLDVPFGFEPEPSHADWLEEVRAELSLGLHDEDTVERIEEEPPRAAEPQDVRPRERRPPVTETADLDEARLRRQQSFRLAAEYIAQAFAALPAVSKVVLFGSVAVALEKEVPRPTRSRKGGVAVLHECRDIDLAVWLSGPEHLKALQRARSDGLVKLAKDHHVGIAHHQVEVFLMEPGTDRHLGRLCNFSQCPKDKPECHVPGCGKIRFLQKLADFVLDPAALQSERSVLLFHRGSAPALESDVSDQSDEPIPF